MNTSQHEQVNNVYARAYAATVGLGAGWSPAVEASNAVKAYIRMMKKLSPHTWNHISEDF